MSGTHLKRALAACATSALAAAAVASIAWAAPAATTAKKPPRLPAGFVGQVKVEYTGTLNDELTHSTATATVTLRRDTSPARGGRSSTLYALKKGTLTWDASGTTTLAGYECTWTGAGTRSTRKNETTVHVVVRRRPKAVFSSPADMLIPVTKTCPDGTSQGDQAIMHPFFVLMRNTAGVAMHRNLRSIVGSSTTSRDDETWTSSWKFRAVR